MKYQQLEKNYYQFTPVSRNKDTRKDDQGYRGPWKDCLMPIAEYLT